jgi:hypothetical protein
MLISVQAKKIETSDKILALLSTNPPDFSQIPGLQARSYALPPSVS